MIENDDYKKDGERMDQALHVDENMPCVLSTVGSWKFNIFNLNELTNGRPLFHLALHLFYEHKLIEVFQLDMIKLMRFISTVEQGYHSSNPYHTAVHSADVTQAMHCFLLEHQLHNNVTPLEKMVALIAAMTHDLDHPGVNQAFLIATNSYLATLYNNESVLENHHFRSAMAVIHETGVFSHLCQKTMSSIEWQLKSLILSTDISRQQEFLTELNKRLDGHQIDCHQQQQLQSKSNMQQQRQQQLMAESSFRHLVLQIALKCSDIANPCRPAHISHRWSELVCEEIFKQGDLERQLGLPVIQMNDRQLNTVGKIQTGFIEFLVMPLFKCWARLIPNSDVTQSIMHNLHENLVYWTGVNERAESALDNASSSPTDVQIEGKPANDSNTPSLNDEACSKHTDTSNIENHINSASGCGGSSSSNSETCCCYCETSHEATRADSSNCSSELNWSSVDETAMLLGGNQGRRHSLPLPCTLKQHRRQYSSHERRASEIPILTQQQQQQQQQQRSSISNTSTSVVVTQLHTLAESPTCVHNSRSPANNATVFDFDQLRQDVKNNETTAADTSKDATSGQNNSIEIGGCFGRILSGDAVEMNAKRSSVSFANDVSPLVEEGTALRQRSRRGSMPSAFKLSTTPCELKAGVKSCSGSSFSSSSSRADCKPNVGSHTLTGSSASRLIRRHSLGLRHTPGLTNQTATQRSQLLKTNIGALQSKFIYSSSTNSPLLNNCRPRSISLDAAQIQPILLSSELLCSTISG